MASFRIGLLGAHGKMGGEIKTLAQACGNVDIVYEKSRGEVVKKGKPQVLIDVSNASYIEEHIALCETLECALVCGVSGRLEAQNRALKHASKKFPVLIANNFTVGNFIQRMIVQQIARNVRVFDRSVRSIIVDRHPQTKKDAPSATARQLQLDASQENLPRSTIEILRRGHKVATHSVIFETDHEEISVHHDVYERSAPAMGAIRAACWLASVEKAACYAIEDVYEAQFKKEI